MPEVERSEETHDGVSEVQRNNPFAPPPSANTALRNPLKFSLPKLIRLAGVFFAVAYIVDRVPTPDHLSLFDWFMVLGCGVILPALLARWVRSRLDAGQASP